MMKVRYVLVLFLVMVLQTACADKAKITSYLNLDKAGVAIQGYDPVSYHSGKPMKGKMEYSLVYDGATYLFSDQNNMEIFQSTPNAYLPAFGGWCAWAMLDGEKIGVDPESYKIINGITYLFYNSLFNNTLSMWNTRAGHETEEILVQKANFQWNAQPLSPN